MENRETLGRSPSSSSESPAAKKAADPKKKVVDKTKTKASACSVCCAPSSQLTHTELEVTTRVIKVCGCAKILFNLQCSIGHLRFILWLQQSVTVTVIAKVHQVCESVPNRCKQCL